MRKETLLAPLTGIIAEIKAHSGSQVKENDLILNIECMKLLYPVTAGLNGKINLIINLGEFIQEGQELGTILENQ